MALGQVSSLNQQAPDLLKDPVTHTGGGGEGREKGQNIYTIV